MYFGLLTQLLGYSLNYITVNIEFIYFHLELFKLKSFDEYRHGSHLIFRADDNSQGLTEGRGLEVDGKWEILVPTKPRSSLEKISLNANFQNPFLKSHIAHISV